MYVGFRYTLGEVRGLGTKSNALQELETWYVNNLASYANKIDTNAGFCGDRTPTTSVSEINNQGGIGTTASYYGAYIRLATNKLPDLKCTNASDLYTVSRSNKGNKSLSYPIGLINVDEVSIAGVTFATASPNYYLYNGQNYWTLSPSYYYATSAYLFLVESNGRASGGGGVSGLFGLRPAINLRSDVTLTGNGTIETPYEVL